MIKNGSGVYLGLYSHGQQNVCPYFCLIFVKEDYNLTFSFNLSYLGKYERQFLFDSDIILLLI